MVERGLQMRLQLGEIEPDHGGCDDIRAVLLSTREPLRKGDHEVLSSWTKYCMVLA